MSTLLTNGRGSGGALDEGGLGVLGRLWHYLVISVLTVIYYVPYVLPRMGNMHGGDFAWFYFPFRIYASQQVHEGSWPFRTNGILGGYPIWQDPQFSLLYPVNLLFAVVFPNFASEGVVDFYMLVNMLILSWACVYFLRCVGLSRVGCVAGAGVIAFCGYTINHAQYLAFLQVEAMSLVAAGLLVLFFRGGAVDFRLPLGAGVALALGNLTGNPQPIVYFHYALGFGLLVLAGELWRRSGRVVLGVRMLLGGTVMFGFGVLLAMVHFLPSAFLIAMSPRARIAREAAAWTPLEFKSFFGMLFPGFYQVLPWRLEWPLYQVDFTLSFTNLVEGYNSLGVFAVALGLLGWWHYRGRVLVNVLGAGCVLLMVFALGDGTPLYGVAYHLLPAISMLRVSARVMILFYPAWAILVGLGVQALLAGNGGVVRQSQVVAGGMVALVAVSAGLIFRGQESWLYGWLGMMAGFARDYVLQTAGYFMAHFDRILYGLKLQLVLGGFFLGALVVLFGVRAEGWRRGRVSVVMGLMFAELFLYGFGWNMAINTPPLDDGVVHEYGNFSREVRGRSMGLHPDFLGSINGAIYMEDAPEIANGYSVTFDRWVGMFQPHDRPPYSVGMQGRLFDLWNVTDIQFPRLRTWAELRGVPGGGLTVGDWGWTPLQNEPEEGDDVERDVRLLGMLRELVVDVDTTRPVAGVHLLVTGQKIEDLEDGAELGVVSFETVDGVWGSTQSIVVGRDVSESGYPLPEEAGVERPVHSLAEVAYRRVAPTQPTHGWAVYGMGVELETSAPVRRVHFGVTAPYPAVLSVAHVVALHDDGTTTVQEAFETAGFREMESGNELYYTLGRDYETGFVRVLPVAVGSSYKELHYPFARAVGGEIDPLRTVVVDKRIFSEEDLEGLNAPEPDSFVGRGEIEWLSDERAVVRVEANQRGWLFLSYAWDAGWRAKVNGEGARLYRGTGAFITLPVEAGVSVIELRYRPRGLIAGALLSLVGVGGLVAGWGWAKRWRRRWGGE